MEWWLRYPGGMAAVRHPEKMGCWPDRMAAVRHPEKLGCRSGIIALRYPGGMNDAIN